MRQQRDPIIRAGLLKQDYRRLFLDQLTATVKLMAARAALREIITLADQVPMLTDEQLRFRLSMLVRESHWES